MTRHCFPIFCRYPSYNQLIGRRNTISYSPFFGHAVVCGDGLLFSMHVENRGQHSGGRVHFSNKDKGMDRLGPHRHGAQRINFTISPRYFSNLPFHQAPTRLAGHAATPSLLHTLSVLSLLAVWPLLVIFLFGRRWFVPRDCKESPRQNTSHVHSSPPPCKREKKKSLKRFKTSRYATFEGRRGGRGT